MNAGRIHWFVLGILLTSSLPSAAGAVAQQALAGFTEEEATALRRGRPVRRPLEDHDRLVGGNAWVVIRASVGDVWRALNDLTTYQRMFRFVDRIEVLKTEGPMRTVQIEEGDALYTLSYILQMRFDEERRDIEFRLDPSTREHLRDGWGFCHLDPIPDGRTLVTFGAAVDPGNPMVRALFEHGLETRLLEAPDRLKRFIERDARRRARARRALRAQRGFPAIQANSVAERAAALRARAERTRVGPVRVDAPAAPPPPEARPPDDFRLPPDFDCGR